jgi:hypothetical protein
MAQEKETTEYSGKVVQYSGGEEKWRERTIKEDECRLVLREHKGMAEGLAPRLWTHSSVRYSTDGKQIKDQALHLKAWNHLVMACQDLAFTVLTTATMSNAYEGWMALLEEYHKNDIDSLVEIESGFTNSNWKPILNPCG